MEEEEARTLYENLEYLNETKGLIKQAIIDKGVEIDNNTPFREYVNKIGEIQDGGSEDLEAEISAQEALIQQLNTLVNSKVKYQALVFDTYNSMTNYEYAKAGELAVVDNKVYEDVSAGCQTSCCRIPATITLSEAVTTNHYLSIYSVEFDSDFDASATIQPTKFTCYVNTASGYTNVQYNSTDGITYVRADGEDEPYIFDFGRQVIISDNYNFDELFTNFLFKEVEIVNVYRYEEKTDRNLYHTIQNIYVSDTGYLRADPVSNFPNTEMNTIINTAFANMQSGVVIKGYVISKTGENTYIGYTQIYKSNNKGVASPICIYNNNKLYFSEGYFAKTKYTTYKFTLDMSAKTCVIDSNPTVNGTYPTTTNNQTQNLYDEIPDPTNVIFYAENGFGYEPGWYYYKPSGNDKWTNMSVTLTQLPYISATLLV